MELSLTVVGRAAAAIPSVWGEQDHNQAYELGELGEGVTQYSVDAFELSLAGRAILSYLKAGGLTHHSLSFHFCYTRNC